MHQLPNRQSHRLSGYDYSRNGLYFITIVSQDREERFGMIAGGQMIPNDVGKMIVSEWCSLPIRFPHVELDAYVLMPNHIHGILILDDGRNVGARPCVRPHIHNEIHSFKRVDTRPTPTIKKQTIGDIICAFKSITTNRYIKGVKLGLLEPFRKRLWQRDYYDHVIRNEKECAIIEQYIASNPQNWENDKLRSREGMMEERGRYMADWKCYL